MKHLIIMIVITLSIGIFADDSLVRYFGNGTGTTGQITTGSSGVQAQPVPQQQPQQVPIQGDPRYVYAPYGSSYDGYVAPYPVAQPIPAPGTVVVASDPVIMPVNRVLTARPAQVVGYDEAALIARGRVIMEWNNGAPNRVGATPYWDVRVPGNNRPGIVFPDIRRAYGNRW